MTEVYPAITAIAQDDQLSTALVCDVLHVCRSAYYAWRDRNPSGRDQREATLIPLVRAVFWKHQRRYGARRIAAELADLDEPCSPRLVAKILKTQGLRAIQPKSFVPKTTDSQHRLGYSPNLILDTPEPCGVNQLWVGDITYVPLCGGEFIYLAILMDRYSRISRPANSNGFDCKSSPVRQISSTSISICQWGDKSITYFSNCLI